MSKWVEEELEPGLRVSYGLKEVLASTKSKWQQVDLVDLQPFGRVLMIDGEDPTRALPATSRLPPSKPAPLRCTHTQTQAQHSPVGRPFAGLVQSCQSDEFVYHESLVHPKPKPTPSP